MKTVTEALVGQEIELWFGKNKNWFNGSFAWSKKAGFSKSLNVKIVAVNPTDKTEVLLQMPDGSTVWAQEINTY